MHQPPKPPDATWAAIEPLASAITALAVITDRAIHELRDQYRAKLTPKLAAQLDAHIAGTMEASIWSNSVSCWVDETCPAHVTVNRLHEVAWPEWDAGPCHVRIERESRAPRSGRRSAYDHQIPLIEYVVGDTIPEGCVRVDAENALNVTGTMLRDKDGAVSGVRFHAIFAGDDVWRVDVSANEVSTLIQSWSRTAPWVALASTPATWAAGYLQLVAAEDSPITAGGPDEDEALTPGPNAERPPAEPVEDADNGTARTLDAGGNLARGVG